MSPDSQAKLLADLQRPDAYPPPHPAHVRLVTTHISWVFIADDRVYKLRRPVKYAFCDFSTPEKRHEDCEAELHINRPLGGDVYQGLVTVHHGPGGYSFEAPSGSRAVECAVRMRRLSDQDACAALVQADALTPRHLQRLAERLAGFYAEAAQEPEAGAPDRMAAMIGGNLAELAASPGAVVSAPDVKALQAYCDGEIAAHTASFHRRQGATGGTCWIREGHGDLRLEHVYFPDGRLEDPRVIDAVEFNRDLRVADVALDVAFLAMELEAAGQPSLANLFLSFFARACSDYAFYPLLDLYIVHRAAVRAKVAALVAADPEAPPARARRKREESRRLLQLALRHTRPRRQAAVICVGGLIGSGKSTVAERLAQHIEAPVISSDYIRKALAGIAPRARGGDDIYSDAFSHKTLLAMMEQASFVLQSGRSVILDATFRSRPWRDAARALATRHGARFALVEATCREETMRARLRARDRGEGAQAPVSDAREPLLDAFMQNPDPPHEIAAGERFAVDTEDDPGDALARIASRIQSASGPGGG